MSQVFDSIHFLIIQSGPEMLKAVVEFSFYFNAQLINAEAADRNVCLQTV